MRGFEPVNSKLNFYIPLRKTMYSAGYDFITPYYFKIEPFKTEIIFTNGDEIKELMEGGFGSTDKIYH